MNYIIIENEPIARESMVEMCREARPDWTLLATFEGVSDTADYLRDHIAEVDLAISDIELVDGNCFEIFRRIEVDFPVIFTTAYENYLLKAFKVNSLDYLLKPISPAALKTAFDKYDKLYASTHERTDHEIYRRLLNTLQKQQAAPQFPTRILTSSGDKYGYVDIGSVAYFLSEDKYTFVVTFDGRKMFTTYRSLNDLETVLDPTRFFRLNRSIIIGIDAVASVSKHLGGRLMVTLTSGGNERVAVSPNRRKDFLRWLGSGAD